MYDNPILRGFCPDPSIIRVGDDYYIATSTFEWWPGVRLFHSKDLCTWEQIKSPLKFAGELKGVPDSGGIWAPCLSYDGEWFYLVYTIVNTKKGPNYNTHNYVIRTKDMRGEWSKPVYLNSLGFDPSLFHDGDGRKYLINMVNGFKGITVTEYDSEEGRLIGEPHRVYRGSGRRCTEGPHMYHIGDYYYILTAEGGTGFGHCETVARSECIYGPYETAPGEPLVTADDSLPGGLSKCGHADIVMKPDGSYIMVFLCSRADKSDDGNMYSTLGRETAMADIYFDDDGWPRLKDRNDLRYRCTDVKQSIFRDDFDEVILSPVYVSPRTSYEDKISLTERAGFLRIYGRESIDSLHEVSLIALRQTEKCAEAVTALDYMPEYSEQAAGLVYVYDSSNNYMLVITGNCSVYSDDADDYDDEGNRLKEHTGRRKLRLIHSDRGVISELMEPVWLGFGMVELKISTDAARRISFSYRICSDSTVTDRPEGGFITLPAYGSMDKINDEYCRGFTGAQFGLYAHDMTGLGSYADFDHIELRTGDKAAATV